MKESAEQQVMDILWQLRLSNPTYDDFIFIQRVEGYISSGYPELRDYDLDFDSDADDSEESDYEEENYSPNRDPRQSKYSLEQMRNILSLADKQWSFGNIQKRYKKLSSKTEILRMRKYLANNGTHQTKCKDIDESVFAEFCHTKSKSLAMHDRYLQEWALIAAERIRFDGFLASDNWLRKFKLRHKIVSRKIKKVIGIKAKAVTKQADDVISKFLDEVRPLINGVSLDKVYNSDQSGINLEMTTGRSLDFQDVKSVVTVVQRPNATTHSLTIQPVISADRHLQNRMLVCFHEAGGAPKKFADELDEFNNLWCKWSTSGKVSSSHIRKWLEVVFLPQIENNSIGLFDKWSGWKAPLEEEQVAVKELSVKWIPPGTTGKAQPLDVFFNRQWKQFFKIISDEIRRCHPEFILSIRRNIACLISLIHRQFIAPRFVDLIRYSWFAAGYLTERPPEFRTPPQYCLQDYQPNCKCRCGNICFISCAHCEEMLCFDHTVVDFHRCNEV